MNLSYLTLLASAILALTCLVAAQEDVNTRQIESVQLRRTSNKSIRKRTGSKRGGSKSSRNKTFSSRSIGSNYPQVYLNQYSSATTAPYRTNIRESVAQAQQTQPIYTGAPSNSNFNGQSSFPNYTPSSSHSEPSYSSYYDDLWLYDDDGKKKGVAIGLPIALVLGPLAIMGLIAIFNLKALFTVGAIRALCTNPNFANNFGTLCILVNNLGKRSTDEDNILPHLATPDNLSKLMAFLNMAKFSAMDYLDTRAKDE